MFRYFIYLSFDGTNYHGWQIQPNGASVQETLMKALSTFLRREIEVVGAGRTDAGVHARLMVAHFDFDTELDGEVVTDKLNRLLPPEVAPVLKNGGLVVCLCKLIVDVLKSNAF